MKCVKKTVRHYWKYQESSFPTPTLSSSGTLGGDSFACSASKNANTAYRLFDKTSADWDTYPSGAPQWVVWYNPNPIKITSLTIQSPASWSGYFWIVSGKIQGSNDNTNWTDLADVGSMYGKEVMTIDMSSNTNFYKYYKLDIPSYRHDPDYPRVMLTELTFNATEKIPIPATQDDYDYYTDDEVTVLPTGIERHYWKYSFINWTQPILTSNTSSRFLTFTDPVLSNCSIEDPSNPVWGNESVTDFSAFYNAFNSMSYFKVNAYLYKTYGAIVDIEFRNPLKISQIYIDGHTIESTASGLRGSLIYDMSNGTPVLLSQSTAKSYNTHTIDNVVCKKIRIAFQQQVDALSHPTRIQHIDITAQERVSVPATSSDYDFYTDDPVYYGINQ